MNKLPKISIKDLAALKSVTENTHQNIKEKRRVVVQQDEPFSRDLPSIANEQKQSLSLDERSGTVSSPIVIEEGLYLPTYVTPKTKHAAVPDLTEIPPERDAPSLGRSDHERIPRKFYN